jgi:uncharacterized membrane protein (Fun14 family)
MKVSTVSSIIYGLTTGIIAGMAIKEIIPTSAAAVGITMSYLFWRNDIKERG